MKNKRSNTMKNLMMVLIASLIMLVGIASAIPSTEWTRTFDLSNDCDGLPDCIEQNTIAESVQQTKDDGYVFAGYRHYLSQPPDPSIVDKTNSVLVKTDKNGNRVWARIFQLADSYPNQAHSVYQTSDGGYILAGKLGLLYHYDGALLIKTDASGNKVWEKRFTGTVIAAVHGDAFYSVQQTRDGGYIAAGRTTVRTGVDTGFATAWLVKTDASGNRVWDKKFGGSSDRIAQSVQQTTDGGYILAGRKAQSLSTNDVLVIKTDASGNKIWERLFAGTRDDQAYSVQQTKDGGYIVAGHTASSGAGSEDAWLIKLDAGGNKIWSKTFGGANADGARSVQQTSDEGYILSGYTTVSGWLLKTDTNGNKIWDKTYGTGVLKSVKQTKYGGYITGGSRVTSYDMSVASLAKLGVDTPSTPANLLKNPGFEVVSGSLPQYWVKTQTGTTATFTYPATGRVGGKAIAIRYAVKAAGKVALWQQTGVGVVPSKQYKLSGYMKLEGVTGGGVSPRYNGAGIRINWYTSANVLIKTDVITKSGTLGWAKYEKTFTSPANAAKVTVAGDLYNAAGKVTFDDMSFVKVS